jgi:hypothetical protein
MTLNVKFLEIENRNLAVLDGAKHRPYMFIEVEEKQLNLFNLTSKDLIEYIKSLGYLMYRINAGEGLDDHICIPIEKQEIQLNKYPYTLLQV